MVLVWITCLISLITSFLTRKKKTVFSHYPAMAPRCICVVHRTASRGITICHGGKPGPITAASAHDLIPPGSYRCVRPGNFTRQSHKVWPNMDTSPLRMPPAPGGDPPRRELLRGSTSLTFRGTPVPHRTCITTHTRFHTVTITRSHHHHCHRHDTLSCSMPVA